MACIVSEIESNYAVTAPSDVLRIPIDGGSTGGFTGSFEKSVIFKINKYNTPILYSLKNIKDFGKKSWKPQKLYCKQ